MTDMYEEGGGGGHESSSHFLAAWVNQSNNINSSAAATATSSDDHNQQNNNNNNNNYKSDAANTDQHQHQQQEEDVDQTKKKRGRGGRRKNTGKATVNYNIINGDLEGKGGGGIIQESDHEMHIWTERERRKKMRNMFSNLHSLLPHLPPKADKSSIVDEAVNYIKTLQQNLQNLQNRKLLRLQNQNAANINLSCDDDQPSMSMSRSMSTPTLDQATFDHSRESFVADQLSASSNLDPGSSNCNNISSSSTAAAALISNSLSTSVSTAPAPAVSFQTWTSSNVVLNVCGKEAQISVCSPKKPGVFTAICYILEKHKIEVVSVHVSSHSNHTMFMIQAHAGGALNQFSSEAFQVEELFKQATDEIMCWVSLSS